ncbi:hypothetical protein AAFC00_005815 [Neodothiora populina]|uniref:Glycosyltransferase family 69 protein n=1 Tax=Neodothiora populina TaxID=2781224 RepID=A0ABR3P679_9PEZI
MRNLSLQPLYELATNGTVFDKILFLNDVVFDTEDFRTLLNTNQGHYGAACSLDFSKPPDFYDTFALRDAEGHEPLMMTWPYFRARKSREAMKANGPVPVVGCWNGMVVMDAAPFYDSKNPLRFRGVPDSLAKSHVEGSECCLIYADNPLAKESGIWVNPRVRVGYNDAAYRRMSPLLYNDWLSSFRIFSKLWENRLRRWFTSTWFKEREMRRRVEAWSSGAAGRVERGVYCLVNEMQVVVANGWAHV